MRTTVSLCLLALLQFTTAPAALAGPTSTASPLAVTSARLTIDGTSTMHPYTLVSTTLTIVSAAVNGPSLLAAGTLETLELQIPINGFNSDKDGLKKKMLETMKADKHPFVTFKLASYATHGELVRAKGTVTVAGVANDVDLELTVTETPAGLHVVGSRALSMKEFGIKAPTMFMGMLKTHDQVTIKFDLQLTHAAKASN